MMMHTSIYPTLWKLSILDSEFEAIMGFIKQQNVVKNTFYDFDVVLNCLGFPSSSIHHVSVKA